MIKKNLGLAVALIATAGTTVIGSQTYAQTTNDSRSNMSDQQQAAVDERKKKLQETLAAKKEARTEKLESKRLEICQKRQSKINEIVTRGTETNTKQLSVFQKIESNVAEFYSDKKLSSTEYDAARSYANEKEAAAVAALEVSAEASFDCASAEGNNPGSVIKQTMITRHTALKEYRAAIKDLILVVKQSLRAQAGSSSTGSPSEIGESQ